MSMVMPWPTAYPATECSARFKMLPDDFEVDETLTFAPLGRGEHLYLRLQKRAMTTTAMARELAVAYGVGVADVGYAGMKDKQAVCRQWFSIATPQDAAVARAAGHEVLESCRHERKLRRGQLSFNSFAVRLREVCGPGWRQRLDLLAAEGVPNYFGPQRFGGDNLVQALDWLPQRRSRPLTPFKQGLYLSVLRSYLFNQVLAHRVRTHTWQRLLPGDVPHGPAEPVPTGPLWGRGRSATAEVAAESERTALAPFAAVCDGLEHAGLRQQRRALAVRPGNLIWQWSGPDLLLRFQLPAGSYATTFLGEAFALRSDAFALSPPAGAAVDAGAAPLERVP